jgi:dTDP-4-amino-4,6-dideoxygalactose transaminase
VGAFPVAERVSDAILSLPMFPQLRNEQQERVVDAIDHFLSLQTGPAAEPAKIA